LLREVESSATEAIRRELKDLREEVEKLRDSVYVSKTWLTLQEARRYVDVSRKTLCGWREKGLPEATVDGRGYINVKIWTPSSAHMPDRHPTMRATRVKRKRLSP
jgi:Ribonuclease G/E